MALVQFSDRMNAELAMRRAKSYAGTMLALSWHEPGKAPGGQTSGIEGPKPPPLLNPTLREQDETRK